jgi:hypothetical protein
VTDSNVNTRAPVKLLSSDALHRKDFEYSFASPDVFPPATVLAHGHVNTTTSSPSTSMM